MSQPVFEQQPYSFLPATEAVIDQLRPDADLWIHDYDIADFQASHGSVEQRAAVAEHIRENLRAAADEYAADVEDFLSTDASGGVSEAALAQPDPHRDDSQDASLGRFSGWLGAAAKHTPEAVDDALGLVIDMVVDGYSAEDLDAIVNETTVQTTATTHADEEGEYTDTHRTYMPTAQNQRFQDQAQKIANNVVFLANIHSSNLVTIQALIDAPLVQRFANTFNKELLAQHKAILLDAQQGSSTSNLETHLRECLTARVYPDPLPSLSWTVAQAPQLIPALARDFPRYSNELYERVLADLTTLQSRTPEQEALLDSAERALHDAYSYPYIIQSQLKEGRPVSNEDLEQVVGLIDFDHPYNHLVEIGIALTHLPFERFTDLLADQPQILFTENLQEIAVRRLTRGELTEQARRLADTKTFSPFPEKAGAAVHRSIRNLLALYEESGDEQALAEAERRLAEDCVDDARLEDRTRMNIDRRRYVAARRQHNDELAGTARQSLYETMRHLPAEERREEMNQMLDMCIYLDEPVQARRQFIALQAVADLTVPERESATAVITTYHRLRGQSRLVERFLGMMAHNNNVPGWLYWPASWLAHPRHVGQYGQTLPQLNYELDFRPPNSSASTR